jgi:beta-lactam-binding protein with PASTA domain
MPYVSGPVGVLLVAGAVMATFVVWLLRNRRYPGPRLYGDEAGIDHEELEAAEREVRELESGQRPDDGFEGDDWGPGAAKPRPPVRL